MFRINLYFVSFIYCLSAIMLTSCSTMSEEKTTTNYRQREPIVSANFASRMPDHIVASEKTVLVDPNVRAWGAYDASGNFVRGGIAVSGADYCPDIGRSCKTSSGTFRIYSLGSPSCKSKIFPVGKGGAPMPNCMFFHGGQALHGSYDLLDANVSHGCIRMDVSDSSWLRNDFASVGTKVIVRSY